MVPIKIPAPDLQIDFSFALSQARNLYLQDALGSTIEEISIKTIDQELAEYAPIESLSKLARRGLRGELLFAVPIVLNKNPRLLGYYRLLLGFIQKIFYTAKFGLGRFKKMEEQGKLGSIEREQLPNLCRELNSSAQALQSGVGPERISRELLDDLTLLTLGPQMRGIANVKIGITAIAAVFEVIHKIVAPHAQSTNPHRIEILNAAGRKVLIEFAADPDIIIREEMASESYRNVIAIEIKGGTDYSNIHNRIGEAEKSHQKARKAGFVECWTVINVKGLNKELATRESPSTNRFYCLAELESTQGPEYIDFRHRIIGLTGVPTPKK